MGRSGIQGWAGQDSGTASERFQEGVVSTEFGEITPNTKGETTFANLRTCLPEPVSEAFMEGMEAFEHKISGFSDRIRCFRN
jgi:uncharacterized FAD-dependent dehydrogenase